MTAKEKAQELVKKMALNCNWGEKCQGECIDAALIAVDEILEATRRLQYNIRSFKIEKVYSEYWKQVKTEIENL